MVVAGAVAAGLAIAQILSDLKRLFAWLQNFRHPGALWPMRFYEHVATYLLANGYPEDVLEKKLKQETFNYRDEFVF
ncbi:MAG: hypothetical protein ACK4E7_06920 [Permianibacter sp.]